MSSRSGAQQQLPSLEGTTSRGRTESGFAPAARETSSLPPLERAGLTWLVNADGTDTVEMTGSEIAEAWREGRLSEETLVWRQGLLEWTALTAVPQLSMVLDRGRPARKSVPDVAMQPAGQDSATPDSDSGVSPACSPPVPAPPPAPAPLPLTASEPEELPEDEVTELWGSRQVAARTRDTLAAPASAPSVGIASAPLSFAASEPQELPEDEVTELWGSRQAAAPSVNVASSVVSDPERLAEDEVTEHWSSRREIENEPPPPPPPPADSDPEPLAEDEVTELWGSRRPSPLDPGASTLSIGEIDFQEEQLPEDEVTEHWVESKNRAVAVATEHPMPRGLPPSLQRSPPRFPSGLPSAMNGARGGGPNLQSAAPRRSTPPPLPPRFDSSRMSDRLTQPSMARIAEMRALEESPNRPSQVHAAPPGVMTLAFWSDGFRGLYGLVKPWLGWVAQRLGTHVRLRGRGDWLKRPASRIRRVSMRHLQAMTDLVPPGFKSKTAIALAGFRTALLAHVLAAIERSVTWTSRVVAAVRTKLAERASSRNWAKRR